MNVSQAQAEYTIISQEDISMVYWKVKDMTSGNECKDGIGYEGIFYFNKFDSKEDAIEFIKSLPHGHGFVKPYKIFRFDGKKGAGKGWHESPGADGKAPVHKKVAERAQAKHAQNTSMKKQGYFIIIEDRMGNITLSHSGSKRVAFFQAEADKEFISDLLKKDEKEDMENGYDVKINDSEPRASALSELWEASGGD